ncbi:TetR/AcrR family transcriptional regulator [Streptomyces sp. GMY02]|uniref:TetR/AcrR family transcriptional regulator n=1 Tax=Streptomyces sp. GMY02 TaxID=1333528 RepID=UPI001C2CC196|nr:TetR/AcrR family transcriptional regulator [Streptomyces sp. GMY02]QXE33994.1 TetR/AcrR family transcriptional regulator [Streptomyces sp. GMY02]
MDVKRRRPGQHHGDLRNALERAALELVTERGPQGFTLAEACRRAGVSVSAPYKHFTDRDALLAALAARSYREQYARFSAAIASVGDAEGQLAAFAVAYVRFAADERALFDIAFGAGLGKEEHPELAEAGSALRDLLMPVARRIVPDDAVALDLIVSVAASAHGLAVYLEQGLLSAEREPLAAAERRAGCIVRAVIAQVRANPCASR